MQLLPVYINLFFVFVLTIIRATHPQVPSMAAEYMSVAGPWITCHNALISYLDANPSATGVISASLVDSKLPPGYVDPGYFTYLVTAPGTVDTYITNPAAFSDPSAIVTLVQNVSGGAITAGFNSSGQILTSTSMPVTPAAAGVPNGAYVIQTTLRTH